MFQMWTFGSVRRCRKLMKTRKENKMQIKISNLKLKNFKGIKNLEINFEGKNANIYGKMQQEKQQYLMLLNGYF